MKRMIITNLLGMLFSVVDLATIYFIVHYIGGTTFEGMTSCFALGVANLVYADTYFIKKGQGKEEK